MGQPLSVVRDAVKDEKEKIVALEQLKMLVTLAKSRLRAIEHEVLNGRRGDQQIHAGTVIEMERYMSVNTTEYSDIGEEAGNMIQSFVDGKIMEGVKALLVKGANVIFGNKTAGETENSQMLILWEHGALIRMDVYHWKYQFSSNSIMKCTDSIYAAFAMKRVVKIGEVRTPVLVYCITCAAKIVGKNEEDAEEYAKKAVDIHNTIKKFRLGIKDKDIDAIESAY